MAQSTVPAKSVTLSVKNIGGITDTTVELSPGITILTGRNATNRTSLLQAIMAALGSDAATIKGDSEEGRVDLSIGDSTYTRRLIRKNGTTVMDGDPYLEDATLADLFAFLLETNDARQAVARADDLREVIMRPVDTSEIESQISEYQSQRDKIDAQLDELDRLNEYLPGLEEDKSNIQSQIEQKWMILTI